MVGCSGKEIYDWNWDEPGLSHVVEIEGDIDDPEGALITVTAELPMVNAKGTTTATAQAHIQRPD